MVPCGGGLLHLLSSLVAAMVRSWLKGRALSRHIGLGLRTDRDEARIWNIAEDSLRIHPMSSDPLALSIQVSKIISPAETARTGIAVLSAWSFATSFEVDATGIQG